MPANPLFSRAHSTFYQHVLATLKVVQKKIKPPSALYLSGLKTVSINTFCPISRKFQRNSLFRKKSGRNTVSRISAGFLFISLCFLACRRKDYSSVFFGAYSSPRLFRYSYLAFAFSSASANSFSALSGLARTREL